MFENLPPWKSTKRNKKQKNERVKRDSLCDVYYRERQLTTDSKKSSQTNLSAADTLKDFDSVKLKLKEGVQNHIKRKNHRVFKYEYADNTLVLVKDKEGSRKKVVIDLSHCSIRDRTTDKFGDLALDITTKDAVVEGTTLLKKLKNWWMWLREDPARKRVATRWGQLGTVHLWFESGEQKEYFKDVFFDRMWEARGSPIQ